MRARNPCRWLRRLLRGRYEGFILISRLRGRKLAAPDVCGQG
jgi:hypothetical protein